MGILGVIYTSVAQVNSDRTVRVGVVSASGFTPTDRWLNVGCIWHTYLETLQECRSRRRIGLIIQDFRETCVSRSLTFRLEDAMALNPLSKEESCRVYNCDDKRLSGSNKRWIFKSM